MYLLYIFKLYILYTSFLFQDALISLSTEINNLTKIIKNDRWTFEKDWHAEKINQTKQLKINDLLIEYLKNITNLISNIQSVNLSNLESKPKKCLQNYRHLIDVRFGDLVECNDTIETSQQNYSLSLEKPKTNCTYNNATSNTNCDTGNSISDFKNKQPSNDISDLNETKVSNILDVELQKAILEVFGQPPDTTGNQTKTISKNDNKNLKLKKTNNATSSLNNDKAANLLDEELQKAILEVFGKPPDSINNLNLKNDKNINVNKSNIALLHLNNTKTTSVIDEGLPKTNLKVLGKPTDPVKNQIKMKQNIRKKQKNKLKKLQCNEPKKCLKKKDKNTKLGINLRFDDENYDYNIEDEYESTTETSTENSTVTADTTDLPQEISE